MGERVLGHPVHDYIRFVHHCNTRGGGENVCTVCSFPVSGGQQDEGGGRLDDTSPGRPCSLNDYVRLPIHYLWKRHFCHGGTTNTLNWGPVPPYGATGLLQVWLPRGRSRCEIICLRWMVHDILRNN